MSLSENRYLFVTVTNDAYALGLCTMLYSLQKNLKLWGQCDLKIYYHDTLVPLSEESKVKIKKVFPRVKFTRVELKEEFLECYLKKTVFQQTYLIFEAFNEDGYEKVIAFDSDMLCVRDFSELLTTKLDTGIWGVPEHDPYPDYFWEDRWVRKLLKKSKMDSDKIIMHGVELALLKYRNFRIYANGYAKKLLGIKRSYWLTTSPINTGLFVITSDVLKLQLTNELYQKSMELLEDVDLTKQLVGDQPVINQVRSEKEIPLRLLNYSMNCYGSAYRYSPADKLKNARIFHFTGRLKPWISPSKERIKKIYELTLFREWEKLKNEMVATYLGD